MSIFDIFGKKKKTKNKQSKWTDLFNIQSTNSQRLASMHDLPSYLRK